jgi:uncharacterized protein (TIRG00374 family)
MTPRPNKTPKYYRLLFTLSTIAACFYLLLRQNYTESIGTISIEWLWALLAIKFLVALVNAAKFKISAKFFNLHLSPSEWNGLCYITTFYSYFMPARLGNIFRAKYLKNRYNFQYVKFITLLLGANYIDVFMTCLLGLYATSSIWSDRTSISSGFPAIFMVALITLIILIPLSRWFIKQHVLSRASFLARILKDLQQSLSVFQAQPITIFKFGALSIVSLILRCIALLACFEALGSQERLGLIVIAICLVNFTALFSLTPGNLGITEGTLAATFLMVGLPMEPGLRAIALSRLTSMIIQAFLGILFSYILAGKPLISNSELDPP